MWWSIAVRIENHSQPTTTYIESAAGIEEGGKTGLVSVVVGVLMLMGLFLSGLLQAIPAFAVAPALVVVGAMMMRGAAEIDWNEAENLVAKELKRVIDNHGNESIFAGSYGWASAGRFHHAQSQLHRFLNSIGGYVSSYASYSTGAAQAIIPHVLGLNFHKVTWGEINSWKLIEKHTDNLIIFGGINPKNS